MSIRPFGDALSRPLGHETPRPAGDLPAGSRSERSQPKVADLSPLERQKPSENENSIDSLDEARLLADEVGLEVRLYVVPGTQTINIRFVEPDTGRVVREFPHADLVEAMAELRTRLAKRIDQQV